MNDTGVEIYELYASPSSMDEWSEDLLGEGTIGDGMQGVSEFVFSADTLVWDFLIVDGEGTELPFYGLDFTEASTENTTVTFTYNPETLEGEVTLTSDEVSTVTLPLEGFDLAKEAEWIASSYIGDGEEDSIFVGFDATGTYGMILVADSATESYFYMTGAMVGNEDLSITFTPDKGAEPGQSVPLVMTDNGDGTFSIEFVSGDVYTGESLNAEESGQFLAVIASTLNYTP